MFISTRLDGLLDGGTRRPARREPPAGWLGRIWLISHGLSANEQYFSLTPNQPTVLSAMAYKPNKPKRIGR